MILDGLLSFSYVSPTTSVDSLSGVGAGTQASNNVIDLGITSGIPSSTNGGGARDIGIGDDPAMKLLVQCAVTFTSGGAATLAVALQGAIDNGSGAPAAFSTWWTSPTYALATLKQGARLLDMDFPRPPAGIAIPRFLQLLYTIGTTSFTLAQLQSYIVLDRDDQFYSSTGNQTQGGYAAGVTVAN